MKLKPYVVIVTRAARCAKLRHTKLETHELLIKTQVILDKLDALD